MNPLIGYSGTLTSTVTTVHTRDFKYLSSFHAATKTLMSSRTFTKAKVINRITLFNMSKEEDQRNLLDIYKGIQ